MFLNNVDKIKEFECSRYIAFKLIKKYGLPILRISDGRYYFAKTDELEKAFMNSPFLSLLSGYLFEE